MPAKLRVDNRQNGVHLQQLSNCQCVTRRYIYVVFLPFDCGASSTRFQSHIAFDLVHLSYIEEARWNAIGLKDTDAHISRKM
jgi:hypothetical protein